MRKIIWSNVIILFLFFNLLINRDGFAWDDKVTHKDLSEYAAESSVLSKNKGDYLKNMGFNRGLDEVLVWQEKNWSLTKWLREGAMLEDSSGPLSVGYIDEKGRSFNHFHNPLKPWAQAGLNDWVEPLHFTGKSSLLWAQDGDYQENFYEGNWSWNKIRGYYYTALTGIDWSGNVVAADETKKKEYFAKTFRGLGHQMHLLQDTAVPDHVRNDAHPEDALFGKNALNGSRYFETWAKEEIRNLNRMMSLAPELVFPNMAMNVSRLGLAPITQLYDTDQYDGLNVSAGINQGLAEYTNANFFSGDTIFAAERYSLDHRHYFPFPRSASTDFARFIAGNKPVETFIDEEGNTVTGIWISKVSDGEDVSHLAKTSDLTRLAYNFLGEGEIFYSTFYKDEKCHEDYATKLIPRAVGYSAGLLDYFFRGNIEITLPSSGIYSKADNSGTGFTKITLLAKNTTSNGDEMPDGSIELVVKYRTVSEDPFQPSDLPTSNDFTYAVIPDANNRRTIPKGTTVELTFDKGLTTIIPVNAVDVYLQLVYRGRLGNEDSAVAVGLKSVSDPTPVDLFNNMDKICINGNWYDAGSSLALEQAPEWDVYTHDIKDAYLKISPANNPIEASSTNYTFYTPLVSAGQMYRAYILGDSALSLSDYIFMLKTDSRDNFDHTNAFLKGTYAGTALKSQVVSYTEQSVCNSYGFTELCTIRQAPPFYSFRGTYMWGPAGVIFDNPKHPADTSCSWSAL